MKKLIFLISSVFILFFSIDYAFCERMDYENRIFEIGFNADFGLSNSYFAANDILKKEFVINCKEIANEIDKRGLEFNFALFASLWSKINLKNGVSVALTTGVDSYGMGSISKDLFDFIGYGNELNETLKTNGDLDANMFFYVTNDVAFELLGFRVSFSPSIFVPLLHAEAKDINAKFVNGSDGSIETDLTASIKFNSCSDLHSLFEDGISDFNIFSGMNEGWGFDLASSLEYQILRTLAGRAYIRLPIVPGHTRYSALVNYSMTYNADDMFDIISDGGEVEYNSDDIDYKNEKLWISRPFRTGAEIAWKPFGKNVSFNAFLGFAVKYPWTNYAKAYLEYNFSAEARLFNILGAKFSSAYLSEVFVHQVGFMLNFRVAELDFGVSAQGANFSRSCQGSGFGAFVGMRFGW